MKEFRRRQPAIRRHEEELWTFPQGMRDALGIAVKHRREIGVSDRRIASAHIFHQGNCPMADRNLREPCIARDFRCALFMGRIAEAMQEYDGASLKALRACEAEIFAQARLVERTQDRTLRRDA